MKTVYFIVALIFCSFYAHTIFCALGRSAIAITAYQNDQVSTPPFHPAANFFAWSGLDRTLFPMSMAESIERFETEVKQEPYKMLNHAIFFGSYEQFAHALRIAKNYVFKTVLQRDEAGLLLRNVILHHKKIYAETLLRYGANIAVRDHMNRNIFHFLCRYDAYDNVDDKIEKFNFMIDFMKKTMNKEEMTEILSTIDIDGLTPLSRLILGNHYNKNDYPIVQEMLAMGVPIYFGAKFPESLATYAKQSMPEEIELISLLSYYQK